jgi:hypothetical protein
MWMTGTRAFRWRSVWICCRREGVRREGVRREGEEESGFSRYVA